MTAPARQVIAHELLGASEAAAALGLHPYKAPLTLWLEKTGQAPRFEGNQHTAWGLDVEPALRQWYARQFDCSVWVPPESLVSVEHPWMRTTPDGLVLADDQLEPGDALNWRRGFEAKNANWRTSHRWGDPGTDEVPVEYLVQCQQGMCVTGVDLWHLVASIGGEPPVVYEIARDEELISMIVEGGRSFMRCVSERVPPPIDGSEAWAEYVRAKYPWSKDDYIQARPEDELLAAEWKRVVADLAGLKSREDEIKNRLAVVIGTAAGLETSLGRIHYKPRRGGPNHAAAFVALADDVGLSVEGRAALLEDHQKKESRPVTRPNAWSKA